MNIKKRFFALLIAVCMIAGMLPVSTFATGCEHHISHTAECGYVAAVEGAPCTHECGADCYTTVAQCTHLEHDETCGWAAATGETAEVPCGHVCGDSCKTQALNCTHGDSHDEACGYVAAVNGADCTFVCEQCGANEGAEEGKEDEEGETSEPVVPVCTGDENCAFTGEHSENCPKAASEDDDEAVLTCTKQEGCANAPHAEACPSYVAPTPATCPGNDTCTVTEAHIEGCPHYVAPCTHTYGPWGWFVDEADENNNTFLRICGLCQQEERNDMPEAVVQIMTATPEDALATKAALEQAVADSVLTQEAAQMLIDTLGINPTVENPVAKIGETGYATLAEAFTNAKSDDTIILQEDLNLAGWTSVELDKSITLDGNGKTISGLTSPLIKKLYCYGVAVNTTIKNLTISNPNINGGGAGDSAGALIGWNEDANGGTVLIENVKVSGGSIAGSYAGGLVGYSTDSRSTLNINNCSVNGTTLTSSSSVGGFVGHYASNGSVSGSVSGVTITCTDPENGGRPDKAGIVIGRINSANVTANVNVSGTNTLSPSGTNTQRIIGSLPGGNAEITGGTYPADPTKVESGNTPSVPAGSGVVNNNGEWKVETLPVVAKIGDTEYTDLADAFAVAKAANDGSTITLQMDLNLTGWTSVNMGDCKFTLDGNKKTITGLSAPLIRNTGGTAQTNSNVTIKDLTISGAAINDADSATGAVIAWVNENTNLTMTGVKVENSTVQGTGWSGGLAGYVAGLCNTNVSNCSVTGTTLSGSTVGGMFGHVNNNITIASSSVGGNTIAKSDGAHCDGSVIGILNNSGTSSIDVNETSKTTAPGGRTPFVIGARLTNVHYTGGSYFTNPTECGPVPNDWLPCGNAIPKAGYEFVQQSNGMYKLDEDVTAKTVTKTITIHWDDNSNARRIRPGKVVANLYADGNFLQEIEMKPNADGTWSKPVTLDVYTKPGAGSTALPKEIVYTVKLDAVSGYTTTYADNGFTITNKIKPLVVYSYSPDKLLQTGAEVLPVGLMAFAGIFTLAAGMWLLRKKSYER